MNVTSRPVLTRAAEGSATVAVGGNTLLGTDFDRALAGWFADTYNYNSNIYDKAIDSVYNSTHVGGSSFHHIVDGNHSLWGAWRAAHDASPNDHWWEELGGALEHLARDTASRSGINPFFSLEPATFTWLSKTLGVSKGYLGDMLTFNAPELIGAGLGVVPLALGWNRMGAQKFSELATSMSLAAALSANPVLAGVAVVAGVKAIKRAAGEQGGVASGLRGVAQGALVTGVAITVSRMVPGPMLLGVAAGIGLALMARHGFDRAWDKLATPAPTKTAHTPGR